MGELNIELFKKVRERIVAIPDSYNQRTYYSESDTAPCGTICCIAGEAIICSAPTIAEGVAKLHGLNSKYNGIANTAARLLGLIGEDEDYFYLAASHPARRLFNDSPHGAWPEPFRSQWLHASDSNEEAHVAAAYLDHIIETGKVLE